MATLCALMLATLVACDRGEATAPGPFNGDAALGYVRTFMDFGVAVPGTDAHKRAGDWITTEMRQRADTVYEQTWTHTTTIARPNAPAGTTLPLRNIVARFNPMAEERVLYVTHWDSRPVAEKSSTEAQRNMPTPGANDGGSGVGLFLALGDLLKMTPPSIGVDLVFVDGEDYGQFTPDVDVLLGSTYFANNLPSATYQPLFGSAGHVRNHRRPSAAAQQGHARDRRDPHAIHPPPHGQRHDRQGDRAVTEDCRRRGLEAASALGKRVRECGGARVSNP